MPSLKAIWYFKVPFDKRTKIFTGLQFLCELLRPFLKIMASMHDDGLSRNIELNMLLSNFCKKASKEGSVILFFFLLLPSFFQ